MAKQAAAQHSTTAKICAAHDRAYLAMRLAIEARDKIEARVFNGISINVSARVTSHAGVFTPLKKGEFRTSASTRHPSRNIGSG